MCTLSIISSEPGVGGTSSVRNLKREKALLNRYPLVLKLRIVLREREREKITLSTLVSADA